MFNEFFSKYDGEEAVVKKQVRYFLYFNMVLIACICVGHTSLLFLNKARFYDNSYLITCSLLCIILCLHLLRMGRYKLASIIETMLFSTIVLASFVTESIKNPKIGLYNLPTIMFASVMIAFLFTTYRWVIIVSIINITAYCLVIYNMPTPLIESDVLMQLRINSLSFVIMNVVICILGISATRIMRFAVEIANNNAEENRKRYSVLRSILERIQGVSGELFSFSERVMKSIHDYSEKIQSQAVSIEEISASVEEITRSSHSIYGNTERQYQMFSSLVEEVNTLSSLIDSLEADSKHISVSVSKLIGSITKSEESMNTIDDTIGLITESSKSMNSVIEVLEGIFDLINLLSLNAAIEAARAGNAGRGFAVVANEVGKLSVNSSRQISEINMMVAGNEKTVTDGKKIIDTSLINIKKILNDTMTTQEKLKTIYVYLNEEKKTKDSINARISEIKIENENNKIATRDQLLALDETAKAIYMINELIQSNTEIAMVIKGETKKLRNMAMELLNVVNSNQE